MYKCIERALSALQFHDWTRGDLGISETSAPFLKWLPGLKSEGRWRYPIRAGRRTLVLTFNIVERATGIQQYELVTLKCIGETQQEPDAEEAKAGQR